MKKSHLKCNKPVKSWRKGKKKVVKACSGNKSKIIHFGASGYGHNYSTAARKSFRARHKCNKATNKLSARYWACKNLWSTNSKKKKCSSKYKCKRKSKSKSKSKRKSKSKSKSKKAKANANAKANAKANANAVVGVHN
jgi:hypothetical protein